MPVSRTGVEGGEDEETVEGWSPLMKAGVIAAPALTIALLMVALIIAPSWSDRAWTALIWISGTSLGWALGTIASPIDSREKKTFSQIGTLASGLISGFLAAKLTAPIDEAIRSGAIFRATPVLNAQVFMTSALLAALLIYVLRSYK